MSQKSCGSLGSGRFPVEWFVRMRESDVVSGMWTCRRDAGACIFDFDLAAETASERHFVDLGC